MPAPAVSIQNDQSPEFRLSVTTTILFLVASLIARSLIDLKMIDAGFTVGTAKHLSALAGFGVLCILLLPALARDWPTFFRLFRRPSSVAKLLILAAALGFILWLAQMLTLIAIAPLQWPDPQSSSVPLWPTFSIVCSNPKSLLLTIPVMAVATPIIEEVVHRGIILRTLLRAGNTTAVISSAILFAILHEPATMPFAFLFGIFLALQMIRSKNLWAPIITHTVANLLVVISATCVVGQWRMGATSGTVVNPVTLIALATVICLIVAWALTTKIKAGANSITSTPT